LEDRQGDVAYEKDQLKRSMLRARSGYNWLRIVSIDTPSVVFNVADSKLS
jgi:hypothetical protein